MKIRISSPVTYDSIVDGPGLRMVIWTQGCYHNCRGCHNPQTHDLCGGYEIEVKDVINDIRKLRLQRGITLSGGEPFLQPEAMEEIATYAKERELDVWAYTGYTFEELLDKNNDNYFNNLRLLSKVDVLVDGKFIETKSDIGLKFRGSSNQRIIDVSKSLRNKKVYLNETYVKEDLIIAK